MKRDELYARARQSLPGGVCASTRLNTALGHPLYVERAEGSQLFDVDGNAYLDMSCGHGAALLGHGHPAVRAAAAGRSCPTGTRPNNGYRYAEKHGSECRTFGGPRDFK